MKFVEPAEIAGSIKAPASKSMMVRAIAAASLCEHTCEILEPSYCDDALAALEVIKALGCHIEQKEDKIIVTPSSNNTSHQLNCNESGLSIRLFSAIAALYEEDLTLIAKGSLQTRPMDMIVKPLRNLGVKCETTDNKAPIQIKGKIKSGTITVDASESSQFLTGLLMALPKASGDSKITVSELKSSPYIKMTLELLKDFKIDIKASKDLKEFIIPGNQQYNAPTYKVEGDWSGAAFPLVAAALTGSVHISGIDTKSEQADRSIIVALADAGAALHIGDGEISATKDKLRAFKFNATDCPDLFPSLAVLALGCEGTSAIYGADRLINKESNRAKVLVSELTKIGGKVSVKNNKMEIIGNTPIGGVTSAHGDHRISMAMAIAGLISRDGVYIDGWECVSKSYPDFYTDLDMLTEKSE